MRVADSLGVCDDNGVKKTRYLGKLDRGQLESKQLVVAAKRHTLITHRVLKSVESPDKQLPDANLLVGKAPGNAVLKSAAKSVHAAADVELFGQQIIEQLRDFSRGFVLYGFLEREKCVNNGFADALCVVALEILLERLAKTARALCKLAEKRGVVDIPDENIVLEVSDFALCKRQQTAL